MPARLPIASRNPREHLVRAAAAVDLAQDAAARGRARAAARCARGRPAGARGPTSSRSSSRCTRAPPHASQTPSARGGWARHVVDRAARRARPPPRDPRQEVRVRDVEESTTSTRRSSSASRSVEQDRLVRRCAGSRRTTQPSAACWLCRRLASILPTTSSGTSSPRFMYPLASSPRAVAFATSSRSRSPVEMCSSSNARRKALGLRPLPGAGRAEQDHVEGASHHRVIPCARACGGP